MMTGESRTGKVAAAILLSLSLCVSALAQRHDQRPQPEKQSNRREVPRPPRSFSQGSGRPERPSAGRMQGQPNYPQNRNPRNYGTYSSQPSQAMRQERSYPSAQRGEVPRPPAAQPRGASPSFAHEQRQIGQPPARAGQPPASAPVRNEAGFGGQGREVPRPPQAGTQAREVPRPPNAAQRHGGDWLKSHQSLPLADQEKALQSDPQFRKLPTQQQQRLVNRLQKFNSLPPQEQQRRLNRIETWEHLTPPQKQQARQLAQQWKQLPPDRQQRMKTAIGDLRAMPPEQRDSVLESDRFKSMFSEQERNMLRETTKLPLAPAVPRPPQE